MNRFKLVLVLGFLFSAANSYADYLEGTIGNIKNLVGTGDLNASVYLSYYKSKRSKSQDCGSYYHARVEGSDQKVIIPIAADGSITLDKKIGGKPNLFEIECWSATIYVNKKTEMIDGLDYKYSSSRDFYLLNHNVSGLSVEANSVNAVKSFLNSNLSVVLVPEVKVSLKKDIVYQEPKNRFFKFGVFAEAGPIQREIFYDRKIYLLPDDTMDGRVTTRQRWLVVPEFTTNYTITSEAAVFTEDSNQKTDKWCKRSSSQTVNIYAIPETLNFDLNLDCEPVP